MYWSGTLHSDDGRTWALGAGELVLDRWSTGDEPGASVEPAEKAPGASVEPSPAPPIVGPSGARSSSCRATRRRSRPASTPTARGSRSGWASRSTRRSAACTSSCSIPRPARSTSSSPLQGAPGAPALLDRQGPPGVGHPARPGRPGERRAGARLEGRQLRRDRDRARIGPVPALTIPGRTVPGPMAGARTLDSGARGEPRVTRIAYAAGGCDPAGRSQERRSLPRLPSARCRASWARSSRARPEIIDAAAFDLINLATTRDRQGDGQVLPDTAGRSEGALDQAEVIEEPGALARSSRRARRRRACRAPRHRRRGRSPATSSRAVASFYDHGTTAMRIPRGHGRS